MGTEIVSNNGINWGKSLAVQSVQEMVRNDPQILPDRYIRTGDETPSQTAFSSGFDIPVIDLALISLQHEKTKLHMACKEWGFFQIVNHGISESLLKRMKKVVGKFFELPLEEKKRYAQPPDDLEGYGQAYVVSEDQKLDWGDLMYLTLLPLIFRKLYLWPTTPPDFRGTMEEYAIEVQKVAKTLLSVMSENMHFKEDLNEIIGVPMEGIRMNYYPPCCRPDLVMGVSPHSDGGVITLLLQDDDIAGLQIRKDDNWITVHPIPNALVINIGDILQIITNGIYKSIEHRAMTNQFKARMSFATFYIPEFDIEVFPRSEAIDEEHPCLYKRTKFSDYLRHTLANRMEGKKSIDFVKL